MKSAILPQGFPAIRRGKITRPQKVVIYGPEGVGKSTLAGQTPEPAFLDTEGGTHHLDVAPSCRGAAAFSLISEAFGVVNW